MEISVPLFFAKIKTIVLAMALLIGGKVAVMTAVGQAFGLTLVQSMRRSVLPQSLLPDGPERHRNLPRSGGSSARFNPHTPPSARPPLLPAPQWTAALPWRRVCFRAVWGGGEPRYHGRGARQGALPGGGAEVGVQADMHGAGPWPTMCSRARLVWQLLCF